MRGWTVRAAGGFLLLVMAAAVLGPLLGPWSATTTDLSAVRAAPSAAHWLGTDHLGRDELTRLLAAARTSLATVAAVVALGVPLGVGLGLAAGWRGGLVDTLVLRASDVVLALPALLVGLVLAAALGGGAGGLVLALAAGSWAAYARLVRTEVRVLREEPAAQALVLLGARPARVLLRHLLPAVSGSLLVLVSTDVAALVLAVSTLSFLGLGVRPPTPEWGSMIVEARPYLGSDPTLFLLPVLLLGLVVLAVNVLAEGAGRWTSHGTAALPGRRRSLPVAPVRPVPGPEPLLRVRGLVVEVTGPDGPHRAVDGIDLDVEAGSVVALIGASGSGKSLTAGALLGLLPEGVAASVSGSVRLAGEELLGRPDSQLRRVRGARIALVPQDTGSALDPLRRVGPQVAAAARLHDGAGRRAGAVLARQLLTWVGIADAARVAAARPAQLSGGMRQRALVAAALAGRPELVVADEPTSALDAGTAGQVLDLLARARAERGTAVLLISHDLALVADRADVVVVLDAGRVVETGPTDRVLRAPRHPVTRALEAAGRPRLARRPAPTGPELLVVADVTVVHRGRGRAGSGGVRALAGVSLTVPEGGGLGVVGESGSGKSTLAQSVVGLQPVTAGAVRLAGAPPAPGDGRAQLVFQDPASALDRRQTVGAALQEALTLARRRGRPAPPGEVLRLLDRVELPPDIAQRRPWQLSGGQRQRVVIARALAARPRLLVLDEPVSSLDAVVRAGVLELLGSVRDDGVALLVVSHDLSAVTALADEVLVLHRGAVVRRGAPAQVLAGVPAGPVPEPAAPVRGAASSPSIERTPS